MSIVIRGHIPKSIVHSYPGGKRAVTAVYVGDRYVWPKIQPRKSAIVSNTGERFYDTVEVPWWVAAIDLVLLGAGGGGAGGDGVIGRSGRAGSPGEWRGFTINRKPGEPALLTYDINAGGHGGDKESPGGAGGATIVTFEGNTYTAPGGAGGSGYGSPDSHINPRNFTWNDTQWTPNPSLQYMRQGYGGTGGAGGAFGKADPGSPGRSGIVYMVMSPADDAMQ